MKTNAATLGGAGEIHPARETSNPAKRLGLLLALPIVLFALVLYVSVTWKEFVPVVLVSISLLPLAAAHSLFKPCE